MTELQRMKLIQEEHDARKRTQGTNNQYVQAKKSESGEINHFQSESSKAAKIRPEIAREHGYIRINLADAISQMSKERF